VEIVAATARSKLQEINIDATLKALQDKQCSLKLKRITQFGELVTATSGDGLDLETLAGALLHAVERAKADPSAMEAWQQRGQSFFRRERRAKANRADHAAPTHEPGCKRAVLARVG